MPTYILLLLLDIVSALPLFTLSHIQFNSGFFTKQFYTKCGHRVILFIK